MPLLVTPRRLDQIAQWYHQLGQMTGAGVGVIQVLDTLQGPASGRALRLPTRRILHALREGTTLAEACRSTGSWLPVFDLALIQAGEQSGRLPACLMALADYYAERARLARRVLADLAYPLLLIHIAVLLAPFPQLFLTGNWGAYLRQVAAALAPLYGVALLVAFACQGRHGEAWRAAVESALRWVPVVGAARRSLALSRLAMSLEALVSAGVSIIDAWKLAADASGSPAIRRAVAGWRPQLDAGLTPAELLGQSSEFPEMFAGLYRTGELSGKTDETLRRLQAYYQEEGTRKLRAFATWLPRLIYFAVMLFIAYRVVSFYVGYYQGINQMLK